MAKHLEDEVAYWHVSVLCTKGSFLPPPSPTIPAWQLLPQAFLPSPLNSLSQMSQTTSEAMS